MMPPSPTLSVAGTPASGSSSSVFDASIDQVWISFPEPPNHTNAFKRPRTSTIASVQQDANGKKVFSYTRFDWNFLSTLSPTVLSWFCVIDRLKKPFKRGLREREKHLDTVLAYFLIETQLQSTLPVSKYHDLFTPKTRYLLAHPVCQLISEIRKSFNHHSQMAIDLRSNLVPESELLKQGIREACRGWAQIFKQKATMSTSQVKVPVLKKQRGDQEHSAAATHVSTVVDRAQHFIGHEFVIAHPSRTSVSARDQQSLLHQTEAAKVPPRRRMTTTTDTRPTDSYGDTRIDMNPTLDSEQRHRRASTFIGKHNPSFSSKYRTPSIVSSPRS